MSRPSPAPSQCPACNAVGWHVRNCPVSAGVSPNLYAAAVLTNEWEESELGIGNLRDRIAAALDAAEDRGRESVGLGDFLPEPCDDEIRAPSERIAAYYGSWLRCSLRAGHERDHENEDSGITWPRTTRPGRVSE